MENGDEAVRVDSQPGVEVLSIERQREEWKIAIDLLAYMFSRSEGCVSSLALRRELERKGIVDARQLVINLKFFDFDAPPDDSKPAPTVRWHHQGKSFYTEEAFKKVISQRESDAETAAESEVQPDNVVVALDIEPEAAPVRRSIRQEEARLVRYIADALSDVYGSEFAPEKSEIAFDVHSDRPGSEFENVDVIAVHWRSGDVVDLVSVEVKLEFSARLVQQANNYCRFADRVWIAVPVQAPVGQAAVELRETDPRLFEYVVKMGIGILACHKRRGRTYEVFPVQWPRACIPDPVERDAFIERHYQTFEDAGAVAPRNRGRFPRLR
jgi:hypothetical protein